MTKLLYILFSTVIIFSCKNDDDSNSNTELIGNWKLTENLMDSGGGSGTFYSVDSEKVIIFESNGTIASNGILCDMSINSDNMTSGTYSIAESTFNSSDCINPDYNFTFKQNGDILIISYPCLEPCQAKYTKQ